MKIQWRLALAGLFIIATAVTEEVETPEAPLDALPAVEENKAIGDKTPDEKGPELQDAARAEKGPELQNAAGEEGIKEFVDRSPRHSASYRQNRDRDYQGETCLVPASLK